MRPRRHPALRVAFGEGERLRLEGPPGLALEASREVLDVLALCDGARDLAAIAEGLRRRGAWPGVSPAGVEALARAALERLAAAGAVLPGDAPAPAEAWGYGHPAVHRLMLRDAPRTEAFRRALEAVVRPGHVVVDVGTGTGALAVFAARAGAARVHAVERTAMAGVARAVAAANGVGDRVVVHEGDARDLPPAGVRADVVVSEWLGHLAVTEAMLPAVAAVRDRCLAPGGALIPARVTLWLAPLEDAALRADGPAFWTSRPYDLDLSPVLGPELARPTTRVERVAPAALLAPPALVRAIDARSMGAPDLAFVAAATFVVERAATLDGLAGWFVADLAPGVVLDTGPDAPETHWRQHVFPLPPAPVRRGARVAVELEALPPAADGAGWGPAWRLRLALDDAPPEEWRFHVA